MATYAFYQVLQVDCTDDPDNGPGYSQATTTLRVTFTADNFADAKAQLAAKFTSDNTTAENW